MSAKQDWFVVHNNLVDRQDLTIFEKMCCIVLARYADRSEFDNLLTLDVIANKMGCDKQSAERALFGLMSKGLLDLEDSGDGKILHQEEAKQARAPVFEVMETEEDEVESEELEEPEMLENPEESEALETPEEEIKPRKKPEAKLRSEQKFEPEAKREMESKVEPKSEKPVKKAKPKVVVNSDEYLMLLDQVYDIVREKINEREARIILNFADHNLDLIKEKYAIAVKSQISDKIEVLINELQKKPHHKNAIPAVKSSENKTEPAPTDKPAVILQPGGQINLVNINKMKMYKEMANQADSLKNKGK